MKKLTAVTVFLSITALIAVAAWVAPKVQAQPKPKLLPDFELNDIVCLGELDHTKLEPAREANSQTKPTAVKTSPRRKVRIKITNRGHDFSGPLDIRVWAKEESQGGYSYREVITEPNLALGKGEEKLITIDDLSWPEPYSQHQSLSFIVRLDPNGKIPETSTRNNTVQKTVGFPPLKLTLGEPIVMTPSPGMFGLVLAVSRTGAVAAFYQSGGSYAYRVSPDGGQTWGEQMSLSTSVAEGAMFTALRGGGVLKTTGQAKPPTQGKQNEAEVKRVLFSDDFLHYEDGPATVDLSSFPHKMGSHTPKSSFYPVFSNGKMLELTNGNLLATMYGVLEGDTQYRTMIVRSTDQGRSWRYQTTVAYDAEDPNPEFAGDWDGYCEPSLALLPDGQLICIMRTEGATPPYKTMYTSWSKNLGKTWTRPKPTQPHLKNACPTLAVLDNGEVACIYGRPGVHVAFSTDQGHTWTHRVTFTELTTLWGQSSESSISCYADMVKVGPNKLLAIAAVGPGGGTRVFPITVDRE